jgi:hypothetical protein
VDIRALRNTITALCKKATEGMRRLLTKSLIPPANPSGILSRLNLKQTWTSTSVTIETDFPDYAYYVEHGRRPGKMPPVKNLVEWCKRHGMSGAEFAIAKNIAKRGTKPHHFLTPLDRMVEMLSKTLKVEVSKEIDKEIKADLNKLQQ